MLYLLRRLIPICQDLGVCVSAAVDSPIFPACWRTIMTIGVDFVTYMYTLTTVPILCIGVLVVNIIGTVENISWKYVYFRVIHIQSPNFQSHPLICIGVFVRHPA